MPTINLLEEAKHLIRFNTVTTVSNAECALYVGRLLHAHGFEVQYQEWRDSGQTFLNVIGMLGSRSAPPLLLAAHLDTVDPGDPKRWTKTGQNPWRAVVRGDTLYGLGAADDKVDLLCKIVAATQIKAARLSRPLMILGTFGEERGLLGAARFCQASLPKPAMALVGEPSDLKLVTRHKGVLVCEVGFPRRGVYRAEAIQTAYEVQTSGVAAHSSAPGLGENAIVRLMEAWAAVPDNSFKILQVDGGTAANVVPAQCAAVALLAPPARQALMARRDLTVRPRRLPSGWHPTLPWQDLTAYLGRLMPLLATYGKTRDRTFTPATMTSTITRLRVVEGALTVTFDIRALPSQDLERMAKRCEQLGWTLFGPPGDRWQFRRERHNPSLETPKGSPVVSLMRSAMRAARVPATMAAKSGCSEAGWYQMVGIPSVVFGPGKAQGNIHQPNERSSLRQIRRAVAVYRHAIEQACMG